MNNRGFDWQASLVEAASTATIAFILLLIIWLIGNDRLPLEIVISMWPGIFIAKVLYNYITGKYTQ